MELGALVFVAIPCGTIIYSLARGKVPTFVLVPAVSKADAA
jgi:hypothetical protein